MRLIGAKFAQYSQRILTISALAAMVFMLLPVSQTRGTTISDLNKQKKSASQKADELKQKASIQYGKVESIEVMVKRLGNQIYDLQSRITTTRSKVRTTESQIRTTEADIREKNAQLAVYLAKQNEALQSLYLFGQSSTIENLINSDSISEVMARDQYVTSLEQKIEFMMHDIKVLKNELETKKDKLQSRRQDLIDLNKQLSVQKQGIQGQKNVKDRLLNNAANEYRRLKAQAAQQQRIENQVEKAIAARLAALRRGSRAGRGTGVKVSRGDIIGYEGSTGYSTGAHLHFEVRSASTGNDIDPCTNSGPEECNGLISPFVWPMTPFIVTQGYGWTSYARSGAYGGKPHMGVDFSTTYGTPIHAAASGVKILDEYYSGYGNAVIIDHGNGYLSLYGHMTGK